MRYEVEQKFPVDDLADLEAQLRRLGATVSEPRLEIDQYYAHPCRDFAATDEALRIRRVGQVNRITYKGPRVDETTKTRAELELPLPPGEDQLPDWNGLLGALGFAPVAEVRKTRRKAFVPWQGRQVEVSLDNVTRLGEFVELELVTEADQLEPAKACIASLAAELGLSVSQRKSYLELLLERMASDGSR